MAVEMDGSGTKYIKWTAPSGVVGLTAKTVLGHVNPDDFGAAYDLFLISDGTGSDADEFFDIVTQITTGKIGLVAHFSTTNGIWISTSATLNAGQLNHYGVAYDGGSTSNDPVIVLNGVTVALTELQAPVGTYRTGTSTDLYIGSTTSGANLDGQYISNCVYNRIFTATEILDAYNSRLAIPTRNGLVFAPQLNGAAELQTFDGATLGVSNVITDMISGVQGTPAGSPVGRADTYLNVR